MTHLPVRQPAGGPETAGTVAVLSRDLQSALHAAADFAAHDTADATRRAYRSDWALFEAWCTRHRLAALPATPGAVAAFLAAQAGAGLRPSTLGRRLAAIRWAHLRAGHEPPTNSEAVRATLRGIRRARGVATVKKAPATADLVRRMADLADVATLQGKRDRALLLVGFAGAFRRAELVALTVDDLAEHVGGLLIRVRRSKTDQEGVGATVPLRRGATHCPIAALRSWLRAACIADGPLFRAVWKGGGRVRPTALSSGAVGTIVKDYAERAGLDAAAFSGHSLRAGFLTSAAGRGASLWKMREVSRHRSVDTLAGYVRDAELFTDHAGDGLL